MRLGMIVAALAGAAALLLLVAYYGLATVAGALALAGWSGLAAMTVFHLVPLVLCALAWRALQPAPSSNVLRYVWFRWTRDAGGDLLSLVPAGGELLGIRAMVLSGIEPSLAAATTVVDITLELCAQLFFTLCGLFLLLALQPGHAVLFPSLLGIAIVLPLVAGFFLAQRFGLFRLLERLAQRLARENGWSGLARASGIDAHIHRLYGDRPRVLMALVIHTGAWVVGIGEAGIALHVMGLPLGIVALMTLESLSFALRSATFFVPGAVGVQEAGYVVLGAFFGIGPETALALSLLKRGRALILGSLGLAAWQLAEGGTAWRRFRAVDGD